MSQRIPVILCIDVEPDPVLPRKPSPWRGFEKLYPFVQDLRSRIAERTGGEARFNWFWRLDPQIETLYGSAAWALRRYRAEVAETTQAGDEHGVHAHAWRWDRALDGWVADYRDPAWVERCVEESFATFESHLGSPCRSARMGDGYFDDRVRATLERMGCFIDLTLEPGPKLERPQATRRHFKEPDMDLRALEVRAYRPAVDDFRRPDPSRSEGLWAVPLTPGIMSDRGLRGLRYARSRWSSMGAIPTGYGTLRLWEPPRLVQPAIEQTLVGLEHAYLAFAIRSDVLLNPWWSYNCRSNLKWLADQARSGRFVFCTASDMIRGVERTRRSGGVIVPGRPSE